MSKPAKFTITKYESCETVVELGQVWYVQIEPIMAGAPVVRKKITDITVKTIELEDAEGRHHFFKTRYPHHSVNFVELVSDGD